MQNSFDTSGTMYGGAASMLGALPLDGKTVKKQLGASLDEQRKRRTMKEPAGAFSMQMMPPATKDLLGGGYGMGR